MLNLVLAEYYRLYSFACTFAARMHAHGQPAAMVAKVLCNRTPRHPPSQVLDNLPEIGF
jgi:hypothetical protein